MKRTHAALAVGLAIMMVLGSTALAADTMGKFGIGAQVGLYNICDENLPGDENGVELEYDGTALFGLNAAYFFQDYFSLEFGLSYAKTEVEMTGSASQLNKTMQTINFTTPDFGDVTQIPMELAARFHYPNESPVSPYFGLGVGYYFNSYDAPGGAPAGFDLDMDNSFGFFLNGGAEIFATDNVAIDVDLKYIWTSSDFDASIYGVTLESETLDLNTFFAGVGVKYYF